MHIDPERIASIVASAAEQETFSGVVTLRRGQQIVCQHAYGWAKRSDRVPNTPDTRFGIASGTKTFTGLAVCRLVDRGLLDMETPLREVLDVELPHLAPEITIRQVLVHSSGIPDYADENVPDADFEEIWRDLPVYRMRGPRDFLPLLRQGEMKFTPGVRFEYCNSGYTLLGLAIEKLTGSDYYSYMQSEVFGPAGMEDTGFFETDLLPDRTAVGYIPVEGGATWRSNIFAIPARGAPDGGLYTTAADLLSFYDALQSERLLGPALRREFLRPQITVDPENGVAYGFGAWFRRGPAGGHVMIISGSDPGVRCTALFYLEPDVQLILLSNIDRDLRELRVGLEAVLFGPQ